MKKQLILIANSDPRTTIVGGVGTYTHQLAKQLHKRLKVLYIGKKQEGKRTKIPYEVQLTSEKKVSNIHFLLGLLFKKKKFNIKSDAIIHAQRPDWIIPFWFHKGKKVITLHGSHYKNIKTKRGKLWAFLYRIVEHMGMHIADSIIAVDHETQREYQEWYPKYEDKIVYHPVGVDTSLFKHKQKTTIRKKLKLPSSKKIFLFVGRFSKEKQVHEMITNLNPTEKLIIVGSGELQGELETLAKGKDVIFAGSKNQQQLVEYYNAADALLLFSTHEGLPTVVLESQACGTPVLCTPVGEIPHIIKEGVNGHVGKDYRKLMNKKLKKEMSKECIKLAKNYDWKSIARQIEKEVYN